MLQHQLDRFQTYYNQVRPHRALDRRTPAQAYTARPKAVPTGPIIPAHYRVRHDKIDRWGAVSLRHNSRLHHLGLGTNLAGTPVTLLIDDLHIRVVHHHTGELIRELILDPTRDYQPRGLPPGPPKKTTENPHRRRRPRPHHRRHPDPGPNGRPQPKSRLAEGHPKGPGLDFGENGRTITSRDAQKGPEIQRCPETPVNGVSRHHNGRTAACSTGRRPPRPG